MAKAVAEKAPKKAYPSGREYKTIAEGWRSVVRFYNLVGFIRDEYVDAGRTDGQAAILALNEALRRIEPFKPKES